MKHATAALVAALALSACAEQYSVGERSGVVTKLSNKGLAFKSWEGELLAGGTRRVVDGDGRSQSVANVFAFNVDPGAVDDVRHAMESGCEVTLHYTEWAIPPPTIDNGHVVRRVTFSPGCPTAVRR